uniref:Uncharacterized protein n=1 Tax=Arundo donax TaxID=35708 RepID=A0A0A8Y0A7_ARUDO
MFCRCWYREHIIPSTRFTI